MNLLTAVLFLPLAAFVVGLPGHAAEPLGSEPMPDPA